MCDMCVNSVDAYFVNRCLVYYLQIVNLSWLIMQKEMAEGMIMQLLEAMENVMRHANVDLQMNYNQHGVADEFRGLKKFQRNNSPTFKGRYDPEGAQSWL